MDSFWDLFWWFFWIYVWVALLMILATTALFAVLTVVTRKRGMARAATIY